MIKIPIEEYLATRPVDAIHHTHVVKDAAEVIDIINITAEVIKSGKLPLHFDLTEGYDMTDECATKVLEHLKSLL